MSFARPRAPLGEADWSSKANTPTHLTQNTVVVKKKTTSTRRPDVTVPDWKAVHAKEAARQQRRVKSKSRTTKPQAFNFSTESRGVARRMSRPSSSQSMIKERPAAKRLASTPTAGTDPTAVLAATPPQPPPASSASAAAAAAAPASSVVPPPPTPTTPAAATATATVAAPRASLTKLTAVAAAKQRTKTVPVLASTAAAFPAHNPGRRASTYGRIKNRKAKSTYNAGTRGRASVYGPPMRVRASNGHPTVTPLRTTGRLSLKPGSLSRRSKHSASASTLRPRRASVNPLTTLASPVRSGSVPIRASAAVHQNVKAEPTTTPTSSSSSSSASQVFDDTDAELAALFADDLDVSATVPTESASRRGDPVAATLMCVAEEEEQEVEDDDDAGVANFADNPRPLKMTKLVSMTQAPVVRPVVRRWTPPAGRV